MEDRKAESQKDMNSFYNGSSDSESNKEALKNLALLVKFGLSRYVKVHNCINQERVSFWGTIKGLLGLSLSESDLLKRVQELENLWIKIIEKLKTFQVIRYELLSDNEMTYFSLLFKYANAVQATVLKLVERQSLLTKVARGGTNYRESWEQFNRITKEYDDLVSKYLELGDDLNQSNSLIF